jgi:hypothetical protein
VNNQSKSPKVPASLRRRLDLVTSRTRNARFPGQLFVYQYPAIKLRIIKSDFRIAELRLPSGWLTLEESISCTGPYRRAPRPRVNACFYLRRTVSLFSATIGFYQ